MDSWGGGVIQMTILLHKPYLVIVSTKGGQNSKKYLFIWFMDVPLNIREDASMEWIYLSYDSELGLYKQTNQLSFN